ncbi:hypothetical protein AB4428_25675, partial [Vibrio lentus]
GFTDGSAYSTDAAATDSGFMAWAISPVATGATISSEGVLNTSAVTPGTVLTITATGNDPYDTETDSIDVDVSNAVPVSGSALVDIAGNSADNQAFPAGVPVQLTFGV